MNKPLKARRIGAALVLAVAATLPMAVAAPAQAVTVACPQTADLKNTQNLLNQNQAKLDALYNDMVYWAKKARYYVEQREFYTPGGELSAHYDYLANQAWLRVEEFEHQIVVKRNERRLLVVGFVKRNPTIPLVCLKR